MTTISCLIVDDEPLAWTCWKNTSGKRLFLNWPGAA